MKPPFVKDVYFEQNCLVVILDGEETAPPAIENSLGDFVVLSDYKDRPSHYCLDFSNIEHSRTLQFGDWTLIDSDSYFALQIDPELSKKLADKRCIFKIANEDLVFDVRCTKKEKFGTKRVVFEFNRATGRAETLGEKIPNPFSKFFITLGIYVLRLVYAGMKLFPTKEKYSFISKLSKKPPQDIKLLSDFIRQNYSDAEVVVLSRPMHPYLKYLPHMLKQMWCLATSKAVFLDRSCLVVHVLNHKKDLRVVQMWHAIGPMKIFGCANIDTQEGQPHQLAELFNMHRGYTDVLISSKKFEDDFIEGFGLTPEEAKIKLHEIPLPRCDYLTNSELIAKERETYFEKYPKLRNKINILYAPTYRMGNRSVKRAYEGYKQMLKAIDGEKYNIIYSPHPLSSTDVKDDKVVKVAGSTQDRLCVADIVISDYSTIIYEAGLLRLPIYLYGFDYADYLSDRALNIDVKEEIPLPFCETAEDLVRAIENEEFDAEVCEKFVKEFVHIPSDKSCCQAIYDLVQ